MESFRISEIVGILMGEVKYERGKNLKQSQPFLS